jgi:hypothetical protein
MPKQKYYDYLKPEAPAPTFSDMVDQQIALINERKSQEAAQQMQIAAQQQKIQDSQAQELYKFKVEDLSELDRELFNAKKEWMGDRINSYYYSGNKRGEFMQDVAALKNRFEELKVHTDNTKAERAKLEGYVSGTTPWTDTAMELKDDINSYNLKLENWKKGGIDPSTIQVDPATGDAYAQYTDINGNPLLDEQGNPQFGMAHLSPTRGAKEYFTPTVSPYGNLLPGKYSKDFSAAASRLKSNPNMTYEQKVAELQAWVTADAMQNAAVNATAMNVFNENYGKKATTVLENDAKTDPGDGSYVPIHLREYVDETMKFLIGNLEDTSSDGSGGSLKGGFPSIVTFDKTLYSPPYVRMDSADNMHDFYGSGNLMNGITNLMVPKAGTGGSNIIVPVSHDANWHGADPRYGQDDTNFKVLALAVDQDKNLVVDIEMYFKLTEEEAAMDPELQDRKAKLISMGLPEEAEKISRKKKVVHTVIAPVSYGNSFPYKTQRNPEYMSILAQLAAAKGYKIDNQLDAAAKGLDILEDFNDEQAQIAYSLPQGQ